MKLLMKKILIILILICILFPCLFSNISLADSSILLTTERAGNYAATFAINFFQNWSNISYAGKDTGENKSGKKSGELSQSYAWPLETINVTSEFGPRSLDNHKGMDFGAVKGTPVFSSSSGTVVSINTSCTHNYAKQVNCGCGAGYGNHIVIDCGNGVGIIYGHLTDVLVKPGDTIQQGDQIGTVGSTGWSTGDHLHFEFLTNNIDGVSSQDYISRPSMAGFIYSVNPRLFVDENLNINYNTTTSSNLVQYGEIKTAYDENASETDGTPVQPSDDEYVFSNKSWIDFVFRNSLDLEDIKYYPTSNYSSNNSYYEKIGENYLNNEGIININELINRGELLPGDIMYTTEHEYLLYVGGTKVIYAQQPYSEEGALKYEYFQNYLTKIKNRLLYENKDNPDYKVPPYGVTDVYRVTNNLINTAEVYENTENLFFNNKGYYDLNTKYSGIPTKGSYDGSTHGNLLDWVISSLLDVVEFLINLILYIVRSVIVGWVNIVETFIQTIIVKLSGNTSQVTFVDKLNGVTSTSYSGERVTIESLFFNQLPITDANFFNFETAGGYSLIDEDGNPTMIYILRKNLAMWYVTIRNISIGALLLILLYLGIRMAMSTIAEKKAKYTKLLIDWTIALGIVIFIHFFMYGILYLNDALVSVCKNLATYFTQTMVGSGEMSLYDAVRTKAYAFDFMEGTVGLIFYIILIYLLIRFLLIYLKRAIAIYILGMFGSFMGVKYAFDKANGKKTTSIGKWIKDFSFNVLLQTIHCFIYVVFMAVAVSVASTSISGLVIAIVILQFMLQSDKIVMQIFGVNAKGGLLDDVGKPESYFTMLAKFRIATGAVSSIFNFGKNVVTGENSVTKIIKYARYSNDADDDMKTVQKRIELSKYKRISKIATKRAQIANVLPIRFLKRRANTDKQKLYRKLGSNISYETKKQIYDSIQKEKAKKKERFKRKISKPADFAKGAFNTIAGVGLLVEGIAPAVHRTATGISEINKLRDKKNADIYRRQQTDKSYVPGLIGDLQIRDEKDNEKDEKDMKKIKAKQVALSKIVSYEENINNAIDRLKQIQETKIQNMTDEEKERENNKLVSQLKATIRNTNNTYISTTKIKTAVNRFMFNNNTEEMKPADFDEVLDLLQEELDKNQNNTIYLNADERNNLKDKIGNLNVLDGLDAKKTAAIIQKNISKPGVINPTSLNNATDTDIKDQFKIISDNLKIIYGINQNNAILNKEAAENYNKVIKEIVKNMKEVL